MTTPDAAADARPLIALTIGDPAGIGPEVCVGAFGNPEVRRTARVLLVGDARIVARAQAVLGNTDRLVPVMDPARGDYGPGAITVLDVDALAGQGVEWGKVQPAAGRAAFEYVRTAIGLALAGAVDAIATAPINKEALHAGGVKYLDHTAMLKALTDSPDLLTLFTIRGKNLKIFFMARHMSLRASCDEVTTANVLGTVVKAQAAMRRFGYPAPKIAVAALNPHAGEHGMFGMEEQTEMLPAVRQARERGIDAYGPVPADAVFHQMLQGRYDAVISLYHDQGHVAAKTLDFERTVSVTTGMPILRTSVDHGTAFDIAGKGLASPVSIEEAILVAADLAPIIKRTPVNA